MPTARTQYLMKIRASQRTEELTSCCNHSQNLWTKKKHHSGPDLSSNISNEEGPNKFQSHTHSWSSAEILYSTLHPYYLTDNKEWHIWTKQNKPFATEDHFILRELIVRITKTRLNYAVIQINVKATQSQGSFPYSFLGLPHKQIS